MSETAIEIPEENDKRSIIWAERVVLKIHIERYFRFKHIFTFLDTLVLAACTASLAQIDTSELKTSITFILLNICMLLYREVSVSFFNVDEIVVMKRWKKSYIKALKQTSWRFAIFVYAIYFIVALSFQYSVRLEEGTTLTPIKVLYYLNAIIAGSQFWVAFLCGFSVSIVRGSRRELNFRLKGKRTILPVLKLSLLAALYCELPEEDVKEFTDELLEYNIHIF